MCMLLPEQQLTWGSSSIHASVVFFLSMVFPNVYNCSFNVVYSIWQPWWLGMFPTLSRLFAGGWQELGKPANPRSTSENGNFRLPNYYFGRWFGTSHNVCANFLLIFWWHSLKEIKLCDGLAVWFSNIKGNWVCAKVAGEFRKWLHKMSIPGWSGNWKKEASTWKGWF